MTLTLTNVFSDRSPKTSKRAPVSDAIRMRALNRLYRRREAVNELIDSLENYQRLRELQRSSCVAFSDLQKCS